MNIINLNENVTLVPMTEQEKDIAINAAYYATLSPHEWEWTIEESLAMAKYVLWASQRLEAINQLVNKELERM